MANLQWDGQESETAVARVGKFKLVVYPWAVRPGWLWSLYEVRKDCDWGLADGESATQSEAMEAAEQALADHLRQYVPLMQTLGVVE